MGNNITDASPEERRAMAEALAEKINARNPERKETAEKILENWEYNEKWDQLLDEARDAELAAFEKMCAAHGIDFTPTLDAIFSYIEEIDSFDGYSDDDEFDEQDRMTISCARQELKRNIIVNEFRHYKEAVGAFDYREGHFDKRIGFH